MRTPNNKNQTPSPFRDGAPPLPPLGPGHTLKILIADDHQLVIDGMKALLKNIPGLEIIATASNGKEVLDFVKNNPLDVILMDIDMPVLNGIETTKQLKQTNPEIKVLALTMHREKAMINIMMQAGACGYIVKTIGAGELAEAIAKVASGERYFSTDVTVALLNKSAVQMNASSSSASTVRLTARETEIMKLIAQGLSNSQIGKKLFISTRTVDTHRTNLMQKLEVTNIAGLIRYAINNGFVE